ncbi:cellulose biosynthesis protein BcsP [Undibacterium sp. TJN19]|uniref:cellulose biosynthesis protein BcsP n=1 Tax=Undibacterium sp. TJN19 TaxID=3413055 RepID=UPI003BF1860C
MDDDVKNLFQKFGQTTDAYREINREADSEQARQRWPLLRDVHVHGGPTPARAHQPEETVAAPTFINHSQSTFKPTVAKATAVKTTPLKQPVLPPVAPLHATAKSGPMKHIFLQQSVEEEPVQEQAAAPTPAFLSTVLPATPAADVQKKTAASGLFGGRAPAANEQVAPALPTHAVHAVAAQPISSRRTAPVNNSVVPEKLNSTANTQMPAAPHATVGKSAAKDKPVSAVFGRLAAKQEEPEVVPEASVNSFFKKIFKP